MSKAERLSTTYVPGEGRGQLRACVTQTFRVCAQLGIRKVVMFSATGEGPLFAVRRFLPRPQYEGIELVVVTPPVGKVFPIDPRHPNRGSATAEIAPLLRKFLSDSGVPVVTPERFPFSTDESAGENRAQNGTLVRAFGILGGGFVLGIQAVLAACDHGAVQVGERVAAMTADTSFIAFASNTESFLLPSNGLLVDYIVCRPALYDISKPKHAVTLARLAERAETANQLSLNEPDDDD